MALYVIEYSYDHSLDSLIQNYRPAHRQFLRDLHARGILVAAGFLRDGVTSEALIMLEANSASHALEILEADPFNTAGFIADRRVREWVPTIGDRAGDFATEFPYS